MIEVVATDGETNVPVGIVSVTQAPEMPDDGGLEYSHPEHEPGKPDVFVTEEESAKFA